MEIQHLNKNILFGAFAKACSDFGDKGGNVGSGECFADDIGVGCPFDNEDEDLLCSIIRPNHWREVFEGKDESEPRFQFGDKVTLTNSTGSYNGVFNAYTEYGRAYVLLEGEDRCSTEIVRNLKAGWDD